MPRFQAMLVALLMLMIGSSGACAGDFAPRGASGFAAVGDAPVARVADTDVATTAASTEPDSPAPAATVAPAKAAPRHRVAARVGADVVVAESPQPALPVDDDKPGAPVPAHKTHALRWQSLLPGVMK